MRRKIQLYPNGKGSIGGYISLKLALSDPENLPSGTKILAEFTLRILDQLKTNNWYGKGKCFPTLNYNKMEYYEFEFHLPLLFFLS